MSEKKKHDKTGPSYECFGDDNTGRDEILGLRWLKGRRKGIGERKGRGVISLSSKKNKKKKKKKKK